MFLCFIDIKRQNDPMFPSLLNLLLFILSLLLPEWLLLIAFIPILMVLSFNGLVPPLFSVGDADIWIFDLILFITMFRVAGSIIVRKRTIYIHPIYLAIVLFLSALLVATLIAYYRFGEDVFIGEMIAFLRLLAQISVFFLIPHTLLKTTLISPQRVVQYWGYGLAAFIYLSVVLFTFGIRLGEIQTTKGIIRYFGPVGDQVGFILIFFVYKKLIEQNLIGTLFFTGAVFATGTRGSVSALITGIVVAIFQMRHETQKIGTRVALLFVVLAIFTSLIVLQDFGGVRSRFSSGPFLESGLAQRMLTNKLALQVFLDNPLTGVGYTGFRYQALDYGARQIFSEQLGGFAPNFIATAENQFLQVATDGGIFALLSFIWMSLVFLRTLKSAANTTKGETSKFYLAGYIWLLSLLIGSQTVAWLLPASLISYLLWIVLGLAVAAKSFPTAQGRRPKASSDNSCDSSHI